MDEYGRHIVQYPKEYSLCAGCTSCEIVCSLTHDGVVGPRYNRIFLERSEPDMMHVIHACMHCTDHPCYEKCPKQGEAMQIDENGVVYIVEAFCIGCGLCAKACSFTPARINMVKSADKQKRKAKKCDLCRTRAEGPACIAWCPVRCIGMSDEAPPVAVPMEATPTGAALGDPTGKSGDPTGSDSAGKSASAPSDEAPPVAADEKSYESAGGEVQS